MKLIDTNVILRFLVAEKDRKYDGVYSFFNRLEDGIEKVECKILIFFQVIFVLKSFYKIEKDKIAEMMLNLIDFKGFYLEKKSVVQRTLGIWSSANREIIDCYLVACLEDKNEKDLVSYDKGLDIFGINRIEP